MQVSKDDDADSVYLNEVKPDGRRFPSNDSHKAD